MPRAKTKDELLFQSEENFKKLFLLIESMTIKKQKENFSFEDRDKNIRDVLIHLYEWHNLLINWINKNKTNEKVNFLPQEYNWKTYPQMNIKFWEKHQNTPYEESIKLLKNSHKQAMDIITSFSNDELFVKKYFSWTGSTSLGSYCISSTSSHYDWAIKKIKKHLKG